jgi:hypothetical protein
MASFKAITVTIIWTATAGFGLFAIGAYEHFRNPILATGIATSLLGIHMVNMASYSKVAVERPSERFK